MMKGLVAAAIALLLVLPGAAAGREAAPLRAAKGVPASVLALDGTRRGDWLERLRGASLRRISKRLALGGHASMWAFSPDRSRVAVVVDSYRLRIVDTRRLRIVRTARTPGAEISSLVWLRGGRIIGLDNGGAFVVDATTGALLHSVELPGISYGAKQAGESLVTVLAPRYGLGGATLAVIDAHGSARLAALDRIKIGSGSPDPNSGIAHESWRPALVIDGAGRRAFVVGQAEVAEVDLSTMVATYWTPSHHRSLLDRLHDWLEPAAAAKGPMAGSYRSAVGIDASRIAVTGWDGRPRAGGEVEGSPAGLTIVNIDDHAATTLDSAVTDVCYLDGMLLARTSWPVQQHIGLVAYSPDGVRRYDLFAGQDVGVWATLGSRVFVYVPRARKHIHVVDAFAGRVIGRRFDAPRLLDKDWIDY
jgi:hypothetical protein